MLIVSIVPFFLASGIALLNPRDVAARVFLAVGVGLVIVGGVICRWTFRPVEWTQYKNQYGTAIVLDLARTGPECDRYDEFVEALELQILAAQRKA